jgi:peptide/nickel transport system permease protein
MGRYILQRTLIAIPTLLGITVIVFIMQELMPGDFVDSLVRPEERDLWTQEALDRMRELYGLDQPAPVRYVKWLGNLVMHGDLGRSFQTGEPVVKEMADRLPATLKLTLTATTFGLVIGSLLGVISAIKPYSWLDNLLTVLAFFWISTPGFVFALIAIYVFSLKIPLFPSGGMGPTSGSTNPLQGLWYMVLPALVLSLSHVAGIMRYARSAFLDEVRRDYVTVARAKGLTERIVYLRHVLRNSLLPLITITALSLPDLLGGAVLIETIFVWQGLGLYGYQAVTSGNYPVIMATNFIAATMVLLSNLLADVAYARADPRIRYT